MIAGLCISSWHILHAASVVVIAALTSFEFKASGGTIGGTGASINLLLSLFLSSWALRLALYHSRNFNRKMETGKIVSVVAHAIFCRGRANAWILEKRTDDSVGGILRTWSRLCSLGVNRDSTLRWSALVIRAYDTFDNNWMMDTDEVLSDK